MILQLDFKKVFWMDYYLIKRLIRGIGFLIVSVLLFSQVFILEKNSFIDIFTQKLESIFSDKLFYIFIISVIMSIAGFIFVFLFVYRILFLKSFKTDGVIIKGLVKDKTQKITLRSNASYILEVFYILNNIEYTEKIKLLINPETDNINTKSNLELVIKKSLPKKPLLFDLYFKP